ncbi:MAG: hypothetical protein AAB965_02550, partial [Patescibacteria group bacterium]
GDLGKTVLTDQGKDSIDLYATHPGTTNLYNLSETADFPHRILFLPTVYSPIYMNNEFQNKAMGGQAEYMYLKNPTLSAENNEFARAIDNFFCLNTPLPFDKLLKILNINLVVVRFDILPLHTDCHHKWDSQLVNEKMKNDTSLVLLSEDSAQATYQVKPEHQLNRVYLPSSITIVSGRLDNLLKQIPALDIGSNAPVFLSNNIKSNILFSDIKLSTSSATTFRQINPTKYLIEINSVSSTFPLIFSENYHSSWKLYVMPLKKDQAISTIFDTWFRLPQPENQHLVANHFANGWLVDPRKICQSSQLCVQNPDGSYNLKIIIEFDPQRWFYVGMFLSIFTGILIISIPLISDAKKTNP